MYKFFSVAFIFGLILSLQSCSDNGEENSNKFLYLPQTIKSSSSITFSFDTNAKINEIAYNNSINVIITNFSYNTDNLPEKSIISVYSLEVNDSILLYTLTRNFSYAQNEILISTKKSDGNELSPILINLDSNGNILKKTEVESDKYISFETDKKGNIVKTIDQDSTVIEYKYDNHRGVFREVNTPNWFIQAVINITIDAITMFSDEVYNTNNNLTSSIINQKIENSSSSATFTNIYGGFWYPTQITYQVSNNTSTQITDIQYMTLEK